MCGRRSNGIVTLTAPKNRWNPVSAIHANLLIRMSKLISPTRLSNLTIVVVEDHNDTRKFLGFFLSYLGAKVLVAEDAVEGLELVKTHHPNLVLSDISMPGRDGFGLLSDIRALAPDAGGNTPVIAMTAFVDRARILNAGFNAFLSKPFSPETLVEVLLTALKD
jgi:CheY-like chemotaxis protein